MFSTCCQCASYDQYHKSFVMLLSTLSANKVKNETLATHLCEYFDIKKSNESLDRLIALLKTTPLTEADYKRITDSIVSTDTKPLDLTEILKHAGEIASTICKDQAIGNDCEKIIKTLSDIGKEYNKDAIDPEKMIKLFGDITKSILPENNL